MKMMRNQEIWIIRKKMEMAQKIRTPQSKSLKTKMWISKKRKKLTSQLRVEIDVKKPGGNSYQAFDF